MEKVFDIIWFQKHQKILLWLLNAPVIKIWFRWVLRIRRFDCKLDEKICEIQPNNYKVDLGLKWTKQEGIKHWYRADFRTNEKYARRLYFAFKPLWYILHIWDLFADKKTPQLSFGFSTLTAYPVPGTTVDGYVRKQTGQSTWATIHDATDGNAVDYSSTLEDFAAIRCDAVDPLSNRWFLLKRYFCLFDTSSLTSGATISQAVLSLYGQSTNNTGSMSPTLNIYTSSPASNTVLANADYDQLGTTAQCDSAIAIGSFSTSGYNNFTLNATGRGNVSKTGISKFGAREAAYDATNTEPTWTSTGYIQFTGYYASNDGTTNDPKLVVTYSVASGPTNLKTYNTNPKSNCKTINTNAIANCKSLNTNT